MSTKKKPPKIILTTELLEVPFDKLDRDPSNVRRTASKARIEELAAGIVAHGLLQNLGVRPAVGEDGSPTGRYLVAIGGRRLAALTLLVQTKRLTKTTPIPCRLVSDGEETSAGLVENMHREQMNPVDAYEAFARLADDVAIAGKLSRSAG